MIINGELVRNIRVLDKVSGALRMKVEMATIRKEIGRCIIETGAHKLLNQGDRYGDFEFRRAMDETRAWLGTSSGRKIVKDKLPWGILAEMNDDESLLRWRDARGNERVIDPYDLHRAKGLTIQAPQELRCEGCDTRVPCASLQADRHVYCLHCLSAMGNEGSHDCKHLECHLYECEHSVQEAMNEEFNFDYDDDDYDQYEDYDEF